MDTHPLVVRRKRGFPRSLLAIVTAALFAGALGSAALAAQPEVPGNNGTVKIHEGAGEPASEVRNEPHVCTFHLHFFFADAGDAGTWEIQEWSPGDKGTVVLSGTYLTDENGEDRDPDAGVYELPDGHYKLFWDGDLDTNKHDKHKVFWVDCEEEGGVGPAEGTPTPTPPSGGVDVTPTPTPPSGGVEVTPTPTPPGGGVGPGEGTPSPTPPSGGVGPAEGTPTPTPPSGAVAGATATPATTLPPTDTGDSSASGTTGMWAALLLLIAIATTVTMATVPVTSMRRGRRR